MAYKFQQGDAVFHTSTPEAPNVTGLYTVQQVGTDGMVYRLVDRNGDYTDADETQMEEVEYALFTRIPEGWPIVIATYDKVMHKRFLNSDRYKYVLAGSPIVVLDAQALILAKLEQDEQATG